MVRSVRWAVTCRSAADAVAIACLWGLRGQVDEIFNVALWLRWFSQLDRSFLFLLTLPFVVAAVGLWAELNERNVKKTRQPRDAARLQLSDSLLHRHQRSGS